MFEAIHNWILGLGQWIYDYYMSIQDNLAASVEVMGVGYLGIFIVIGIIILAVYLINWLFRER